MFDEEQLPCPEAYPSELPSSVLIGEDSPLISREHRRQMRGSNEHSRQIVENQRHYHDETIPRLPTTNNRRQIYSSSLLCLCLVVSAALVGSYWFSPVNTPSPYQLTALDVELEGKSHHNKKHHHHKHHHRDHRDNATRVFIAEPTERCDWVVENFVDKYFWVPDDEKRQQYYLSTADANVFYRATANIFWVDYVTNGWGQRISLPYLNITARQYDGTPLQPKSLWTWVTGDQHLSNFGAWRNRHGDVVFGVNDFDEAAIYDFGVDVLRIAVSVCSHAHTNGLTANQIREVLRAFTDTYVQTVINYVGSDRELTWELTPETSTGSMKAYLKSVRDDRNSDRQLEKFTEVDAATGKRRFIRNDKTHLVKVSAEVEQNIRQAFTQMQYGATMMKMGWRVRDWNDEYFEILDIAARVGSGIGSYGVDRYYVLLKGTDKALEDWADGESVILDVKYEPPGAVAHVLTEDDTAWYKVLFENDAQRAVEAQRRLTSYTDPFTGWVVMDDKPFVVRQRSPWKNSPDLNLLSDPDHFIDFMEQVAMSTATSHVRGTVSKSPGQFKHVIASALMHYRDRTAWGRAVEQVAMEYRQQVLLDFQCFRDYAEKLYPGLHDDGDGTEDDDIAD